MFGLQAAWRRCHDDLGCLHPPAGVHGDARHCPDRPRALGLSAPRGRSVSQRRLAAGDRHHDAPRRERRGDGDGGHQADRGDRQHRLRDRAAPLDDEGGDVAGGDRVRPGEERRRRRPGDRRQGANDPRPAPRGDRRTDHRQVRPRRRAGAHARHLRPPRRPRDHRDRPEADQGGSRESLGRRGGDPRRRAAAGDPDLDRHRPAPEISQPHDRGCPTGDHEGEPRAARRADRPGAEGSRAPDDGADPRAGRLRAADRGQPARPADPDPGHRHRHRLDRGAARLEPAVDDALGLPGAGGSGGQPHRPEAVGHQHRGGRRGGQASPRGDPGGASGRRRGADHPRPVALHRELDPRGAGPSPPRRGPRQPDDPPLHARLANDADCHALDPDVNDRHLRLHGADGLHDQQHHDAGIDPGDRDRRRRCGGRPRKHLPPHGGVWAVGPRGGRLGDRGDRPGGRRHHPLAPGDLHSGDLHGGESGAILRLLRLRRRLLDPHEHDDLVHDDAGALLALSQGGGWPRRHERGAGVAAGGGLLHGRVAVFARAPLADRARVGRCVCLDPDAHEDRRQGFCPARRHERVRGCRHAPGRDVAGARRRGPRRGRAAAAECARRDEDVHDDRRYQRPHRPGAR